MTTVTNMVPYLSKQANSSQNITSEGCVGMYACSPYCGFIFEPANSHDIIKIKEDGLYS